LLSSELRRNNGPANLRTRPTPMTSRARILIAALRAFVLVFGAAALWLARDAMSPDGIAYLDASDVYLSGGWPTAGTGYWSPLYPTLLAIARLVAGQGAVRELSIAQSVNFILFLCAFAALEYLVREVRWTSRARLPGAPPNDTTWQVLVYALFGVLTVGGIAGLAVRERGFDMPQPTTGLGKVLEVLAIERGFHRAAIGVAAQDGVFHLEHFDRVFNGCRGAIDIGGCNGNHVARIARDEEIARARAKDEVRHHAGIGTGNEQHLGGLALSEEMKLVAPGGKDFRQESLVPFNQLIHAMGFRPVIISSGPA